MRLLILPLILTALPASAAPQGQAPEAPEIQLVDPIARPLSDTCKRPDVHQAETPEAPRHSKLGDLPDGDVILGLYNEVDGCMAPIVVRYGEGRAPGPASPEPVRPQARVWR